MWFKEFSSLLTLYHSHGGLGLGFIMFSIPILQPHRFHREAIQEPLVILDPLTTGWKIFWHLSSSQRPYQLTPWPPISPLEQGAPTTMVPCTGTLQQTVPHTSMCDKFSDHLLYPLESSSSDLQAHQLCFLVLPTKGFFIPLLFSNALFSRTFLHIQRLFSFHNECP